MARSSASVPIRLMTMIAVAAAALAISVTAAARSHFDRLRGVPAAAVRMPALPAGLQRGASVFQIERCMEELRNTPTPPAAARSHDLHRMTLPPAFAPEEEGFRCPISGTDA
jgi:hypothetical protein